MHLPDLCFSSSSGFCLVWLHPAILEGSVLLHGFPTTRDGTCLAQDVSLNPVWACYSQNMNPLIACKWCVTTFRTGSGLPCCSHPNESPGRDPPVESRHLTLHLHTYTFVQVIPGEMQAFKGWLHPCGFWNLGCNDVWLGCYTPGPRVLYCKAISVLGCA